MLVAFGAKLLVKGVYMFTIHTFHPFLAEQYFSCTVN